MNRGARLSSVRVMHALEASIRSRADGITYLSLARDLDYDTLVSWGEDPQSARTLLGLSLIHI